MAARLIALIVTCFAMWGCSVHTDRTSTDPRSTESDADVLNPDAGEDPSAPVDCDGGDGSCDARTGVIAYGHAECDPFDTSSIAFVDIPGSEITLENLKPGDVCSWDFTTNVRLQAGSVLTAMGVVTRPDGKNDYPKNFAPNVANTTADVTAGLSLASFVTYVVTEPGTYKFRIQLQSDSALHTQTAFDLNERVVVIRQ